MKLSEVLDLQRRGDSRFEAGVAASGVRAFGGHLMAQAMVAAARTADPARMPSSLHAVFLRPGEADGSVAFEVERVRDGGSFTTRRVVVSQGGRELLQAVVSFHAGEAGADWQAPVEASGSLAATTTVPEVAAATPLAGYPALDPFEIRPVHPWERGAPARVHPYWARLVEPVDEPLAPYAAVALLSDVGVSGTARKPGSRISEQRAGVTVDHALWWHRPPRVDEWILVDVTATTNAYGRGFALGSITTAGGELLASLAQEAVLREPGAASSTAPHGG